MGKKIYIDHYIYINLKQQIYIQFDELTFT